MPSIDLGLWAFLGTFYLLYLTWQDLRNNHNIDDRNNYFMMGLSVGINYVIKNSFLYVLSLVIIIITLIIFNKKYKTIGEGDISAVSWIIFGLGLIGWLNLAFFFVSFLACNIVFLVFKSIIEKMIKSEIKVAYYPIILVSYIISCFYLKIY